MRAETQQNVARITLKTFCEAWLEHIRGRRIKFRYIYWIFSLLFFSVKLLVQNFSVYKLLIIILLLLFTVTMEHNKLAQILHFCALGLPITKLLKKNRADIYFFWTQFDNAKGWQRFYNRKLEVNWTSNLLKIKLCLLEVILIYDLNIG